MLKQYKAILVGFLAVAMTLTFSTIDFADANKNKYEANEVSNAIKAITPYVVQNENGLVELSVDKKELPLNDRMIMIAIDYMELQNSFTNHATNNPDRKFSPDGELVDKFSKFIDDIQEKKEVKPQQQTSSLSWILPKAFALGEVCGGAPWNPQPEPPVLRVTISQDPANFLLGAGYHKVLPYASWNYGKDYAKVVNAFGCGNGEMRAQGVVTGTNTYHSQSPEPNPEILSYTAPVWWWDGYVFAWHVRR